MQFQVHALDGQQQVVSFLVEAASEAGAREGARRKGLEPFRVEPGQRLLPEGLRPRKAFPTMLFSMELRSLLDAGLNLVEALQTLSDKEQHGERHEVLAGLVAALHRGEPFSAAVAAFPQHFPPLYVATVKASERTGSMREALGRYIEYQEELDRVKKKIVSASIYPAILLLVGALVLGFLLLYVVPRFAGIYEDMSGDLPFFSQLLLGFGKLVGQNAFLFSILSFSTVMACGWALSHPQVRTAIQLRLWRVPGLGERMKVYQLSRLYRTAGMLLRAGIPAVRALEMVEDLLPAHLRGSLLAARAQIRDGGKMSAALAAAGLATPVASRMMAVGERSGDMGRMFGEIARFHDDEVARFVDWFTRAFEPALMAVLGVAVGLVVVLMYMPIFELAGSLK